MFIKKIDGNLEESETEDSYESQKFKYGNKDTYASICQIFLVEFVYLDGLKEKYPHYTALLK